MCKLCMSKLSTQVSLKTKHSRLEDTLYLSSAWYSTKRFVYTFFFQEKCLGNSSIDRLSVLHTTICTTLSQDSTHCQWLANVIVYTPGDGHQILLVCLGLIYPSIQLRYQNCVLPKTQIEEFKIIYTSIYLYT